MKLSVLIVEDNPLTAIDLKEILTEKNFEVVGTSKSFDESLLLYHEKHPDIILADIMIKGEKDGIQFAQTIQKLNNPSPIIFLTGNSDETTKSRAFKTKPAAFLIKPFNAATVIASLELAMESHNQKKYGKGYKFGDFLFVKKGDKYLKINPDDILYLEAEGSYSRLFTTNNNFLISGNLKSYDQKFGRHFIRTHKSYLVNIHKIQSLDSNHVYLQGGQVPIGRQFKEKVKDLLT